ncbi:MAG: 1-acyl-sn-glycerol-3-phosphate acyltransferase, partial [Bacilli bacterium]
MKSAKKWFVFEWFFLQIVRILLRRHFHSIHITMKKKPNVVPTLFIINHSSWWDGLVLFWLNKTQLNHNLFTMMSIEGLNAFPFFRALGGYSVDSKSYTHTKQSLH